MPSRLPSPEEIERVLAEHPGGAMTARELVEALRVPTRRRSSFRRLLRRLAGEGRLVLLRGRRYGARKVLGDVVGRYTRHPAGFGFVVPDDPEEPTDVFIPPGAQDGALSGDVVAVQVTDVKPDGRREGRIVRVVERKSLRVPGVFHPTASGGGLVQPLDAGFECEVLVPRDATRKARAGEIVTVELEELPDGSGRCARGKVVERLGFPDEPGIDVEVLIRKYALEPEFPPEVLAEVEALPGDPRDWPLSEREDFTDDPVVTIDGETAKDFDDAICVTRLPGGGYRLSVHIADVSFFVPEGSETDREALRRGTSVYFPGRVVPMLPERLSNDLCSLRPRELRLTQGVTIDYDVSGKVVAARFHDGVIRSRARLTYNEVAAMLEDGDAALRRKYRGVLPMLEAAGELARILGERRRRRGAIDFDLPEPELVLSLTGETERIVARERNLAHRLIEEFMLAANEVVATELRRKREPALYRVHERPDPVRVAKLAEALDGLGYTVPEPYESIRPKDLARLTELAKGKPEEPFVTRMVLRTMALARYDAECLGHFGLALRRYCHFTSPIRRYPDLVVHRALRRLRRGPKESAGEREDRIAQLPELARECSRLEREAEAAERESIAWKMAAYMAERLGDEFEGHIVDVGPHGLTITIEDPWVEGIVPIKRLGEEYFRYDARRRVLRGAESGVTFRLGGTIRVLVERVDLLRHTVDFAPVEPTVAVRRSGRRGGRSGRRTKAKAKAKVGRRGGRSARGGRKKGRR